MIPHKKILLVDDDIDDQIFFREALQELQLALDCFVVNNGLEALQHLDKVPPPPSIIFLDLNMPFMNGFECLAELKKRPGHKEIPVIIFTTSDHPVDKERTMSLGAKQFLTKPADFDVLKDQLLDILKTDFK